MENQDDLDLNQAVEYLNRVYMRHTGLLEIQEKRFRKLMDAPEKLTVSAPVEVNKTVYLVVNDLYRCPEAIFDNLTLANEYLAKNNKVLKDGTNEMSIEEYMLNPK